MQPLRNCLPHDGQRRRRFFHSSTLFSIPERAISKATQKVEAKSASTCGSGDITLIFDV
jgi:hypothetical protein